SDSPALSTTLVAQFLILIKLGDTSEGRFVGKLLPRPCLFIDGARLSAFCPRNAISVVYIGFFFIYSYPDPFGASYVKIGTIQRRLAWPLHKDDTLFRSGRPTGLNIYFTLKLKL
ncbi:hypothetical protein L218DRAFT_889733, partial [Marasmius fiardii PR-910]